MNAGTIVGHVTQANGSPVSGAEIWISPKGDAESKPAARTDARGYFQLTFSSAGNGEINKISGNLSVSIGAGKSERANSESCAAESRFRVTGYLVNETLPPDA